MRRRFRSGLRALRVWAGKPQGKSIFKYPTGSKKSSEQPPLFRRFYCGARRKGGSEHANPFRPTRRTRVRPRPSRRSVSSTVTDERRGRREAEREGVSQVTCLPFSPRDLAHEKPSPASIFSLYSLQKSISGTMIIHFEIFNDMNSAALSEP